jgi:hypothetical protein
LTSGRALSFCPDPFAEGSAGAGVGVGDGDLLGVADDPVVDLVLTVIFGTVPEVEAVCNKGTMLGVDEDEDEDGCVALVEVLAFGGFTLGSGTVRGGLDLAAVVILACTGGAWSGMNSAVPSALVTMYQLNWSSGTVSGLPVRSQ